jgi:hypothetical protein
MEVMMRLLMALGFAVMMAAAQPVTWGGDHVRLEVTASGAELEFDCATGTISEPLPHAEGDFSLNGTFTPERGGPTRDGETSRINATYSGTIKNDTMSLRVLLTGQDHDREVGTYSLTKGRSVNLMKCR